MKTVASWCGWLTRKLSRSHVKAAGYTTPCLTRDWYLEDRSVPSSASEDMVLRWNSIALDIVRDDHALNGAKEQFGPTRTSRALGIVQAAVYDAVVAINRSYEPYKFTTAVFAPGASIDAAVAQAAHDTLVWLYPSRQAVLDTDLAASVAKIPSHPATSGEKVGADIAAQMIAWRTNDHANDPQTYTFGSGPFDWQVDPLHPTQTPLTPNWGNVTPFAMASGSEFRPASPPDPTSAEYAAAYNEVKNYGGDGITTPTLRTAEQTQIGFFWGYDGQPGLCSPPRLYNQIAHQIAVERGNTLLQNARLLALVNLALGDAGISSWEAKYFYDLQRPITAIRNGANDGNAATIGDSNWTPLGAPADNGGGTNFTPPFPAYTSGHATFGGAMFEILRKFYGRDDISFTFLSDEFNGKTFDQNGVVRPILPRHFNSLSQAEQENAQSRIYLGIHYVFDKTSGIKEGNLVADKLFNNFLRANHGAQRFVVAADVGGGPRVQVFGPNQQLIFDFFAFDPSFTGGVRVAQGDVNGDAVPDIIAATGAGTTASVKVFDGTNLKVLRQFTPFESSFTTGCYVAAGDMNADGHADIVVAAGESGAPRVQVLSGADGSVMEDFFAFDSTIRTGSHVAVGDVDGDGRSDLIATPGKGGGPLVRIFNNTTNAMMSEFFAYDTSFRGGIDLAAGDSDANGKAEVMTGAGPGGGPHVQIFDENGRSLQSYFASDPNVPASRIGVSVAMADMTGDGRSDLITTNVNEVVPRVECRTSIDLGMVEQFNVFDTSFRGRVTL